MIGLTYLSWLTLALTNNIGYEHGVEPEATQGLSLEASVCALSFSEVGSVIAMEEIQQTVAASKPQLHLPSNFKTIGVQQGGNATPRKASQSQNPTSLHQLDRRRPLLNT